MNKINKIFVINLDKDFHRLNNVYKQFKENDIKNYERFPGIYGNDLSNNEINNITTDIGKCIASKNMIGCAISHIKLWEKIVNNNIETSLILEDDFIFKDDFLNKFNKVIENAPIKYDIIYLTSNIIHNKNLKLYDIDDIFYKQIFLAQTLGYVITLNGAKRLLKDINKVSYHIDVELCFKSLIYNYNIISVKEPLIYQTFETSNNINDRHYPLILNNFINKNDINYLYKTIIFSIKSLNINISINVIIVFLLGYYLFKFAICLLIIEYIYYNNTYNDIYNLFYNFIILFIGYIYERTNKNIL
jgi:GR25 family glycosyltransferase involved in LPS biosynthesis